MSRRVIIVILLSLSAAAPAGAESFKSWAARGAREEREKDYEKAASSYSNALSSWDEGDGAAAKAKVLCARGGLKERAGDDAGAIEDLAACVALDKKNAKAFHRKGALLLKGGKTAQAISDFDRAVALDISFGAAYADRARAYEQQGETAFAREDHQRACGLGVKASCARAKALAPPKKAGKSKSAAKPAESPEDAPTETPAADQAAAPAAEEAPAEAAPAAAPKKGKAWKAPYRPKFKDCLDAVNACVDDGGAFGGCVKKRPSCDAKPVKGCCPEACLKAYRKAANSDRSEAQAFRENFSDGAACGVPPKEEY